MLKRLQDTLTIRGVYVLLRRILWASQISTHLDIVVTTTMKRLSCIIYRVDTMMLVLEGLYFDAKYINKVVDIVNKIID